MKPIIWSKFFWSDWATDPAVQSCSLEARGLWLELLCVAAKNGGYLALGDVPMPLHAIASNVGIAAETVERLMAELESHRVFSRDAKGRIYARRLVRQRRDNAAARKAGLRGGNPMLLKQRENSPPLNRGDNGRDIPLSQESGVKESKAKEPEVTQQPRAPLLRAVEAMGTTIDALHRKMAWMAFDYTFANWLEEGCDAERDVWPTIAALSGKLGKVPSSPAYFTEAVREARDRRRGQGAPQHRILGAPHVASTASIGQARAAQRIDPQLEADRRDAFARDGVWSSAWGPKPETEYAKPESEGNAQPL